jgi:hypothetical protein
LFKHIVFRPPGLQSPRGEHATAQGFFAVDGWRFEVKSETGTVRSAR